MLFNAHLCNHILLQSGVGTCGTALYTVRGVGSGSWDVDTCHANVSVRRGSGDPSTDGPGACATLTTHRVGDFGADSLVLILLSSRIDHKILDSRPTLSMDVLSPHLSLSSSISCPSFFRDVPFSFPWNVFLSPLFLSFLICSVSLEFS
jgi:hypothetical protein